MKTGIEIIAEERQRQIDVEGWTYKQDDEYLCGELTDAPYVMQPEDIGVIANAIRLIT